jgi:hypothetical protein
VGWVTERAEHQTSVAASFVLEHLALLQAYENTSALQSLFEQFFKLCELNDCNGSVLNVAHGMIPVCMEFMHLVLQLPENSQLYEYHFPLHDPRVLVCHTIYRPLLNCAQKSKRVWEPSGAGVIFGSGTL